MFTADMESGSQGNNEKKMRHESNRKQARVGACRKGFNVGNVRLLLGLPLGRPGMAFDREEDHGIAGIVRFDNKSLSATLPATGRAELNLHEALTTGRDCPVKADKPDPSGRHNAGEFQKPGSTVDDSELMHISAIFGHFTKVKFILQNLRLRPSVSHRDLSGGFQGTCLDC